jgi:hypothetical protein
MAYRQIRFGGIVLVCLIARVGGEVYGDWSWEVLKENNYGEDIEFAPPVLKRTGSRFTNKTC